MPVGLVASPPSDVSFKLADMLSPTDFMAAIHSSTGILRSIPESAISALEKAIITPETFLLMQGISTRPATGSQTSPI